jgi:Calcineurin-like phosphoesterase
MRSSATVRRLQILTLGALGALACNRTPEAKPDTVPTPHIATPEQARDGASSVASALASAPAPHPSPLAPSSYRLPASGRVVAIGDIHGDLNALRSALRLAGAIDTDQRWVGKDLTVVQTGDQVDRGDQDREVLDELEKLEGDANRAGGALYVLNGNHELMNVSFDFRYVTRKSFASFADFAGRAGAAAQRLPDEERGRAAAFAPGSLYALKLSKHLTVAVVGDSLFAHGGVLPAHVDYGLDRLNREAQSFLAGRVRELPPALSGEDAPVWTRVYGSPDVDEATCQTLGRVLAQVGAKRLVVGHTVQKDGISSACQEQLFRIDVGLSAYYGDNPAQVLELTAQGARILKAGSAPVTIPPAPVKKGKSADSALHSSP